MNLHGRIWMGNLLLFGAGSVIIVKWVDPIVFGWLDSWSAQALEITAACIILLLIADNIVSHVLMGSVKKTIDGQTGDSTEEISTQGPGSCLPRRCAAAAYPGRLPQCGGPFPEANGGMEGRQGQDEGRPRPSGRKQEKMLPRRLSASAPVRRGTGRSGWRRPSAKFDAARAELRKKEEDAFGRRE